MGKTIFDSVTARALVAYAENKPQQEAPFLFETLFGTEKQLGLDISYIVDSVEDAKLLQVHAFDSKTNKMDRSGFSEMKLSAFLSKNKKNVDEKMRQDLLIMEQTGDVAKIDIVKNRIFNDQISLLAAARRQREFMRSQIVSTGLLTIAENGQTISIDYGMPATNKGTSVKKWDDITSDIIADIQALQDKVEENGNERPSRAVCSRKILRSIMKNTDIINSLKNASVMANEANVLNYIYDMTGLTVIVYDKKYVSSTGSSTRYIAEDLFLLLPSLDGGTILGNMVFGTTPEEADLMGGLNANVSLTDTGVAVTITRETDPVLLSTKISQVCVPTFPAVKKVGILDTQITL